MFICILCEKPFQSVANLRQHTKVLECLLQHKVMNNLKIKPTDDQIKDFKEKVYSLSSADYQEENVNSVESEDGVFLWKSYLQLIPKAKVWISRREQNPSIVTFVMNLFLPFLF